MGLGIPFLFLSVVGIVILLGCLFVKLYQGASKKWRIILISALALLAAFPFMWNAPIGNIYGEWHLHSDFRANERHVRPAAVVLVLNPDGTGREVDQEGIEREFEWEAINYGERIMMSSRPSRAYYISIRGFGTLLTLEACMRGEATRGRFDTNRDFRAHFRR